MTDKYRRLADVQCAKTDLRAGDRIIAKVHHKLNKEERRKLEKAIQRWAGTEVAVLVVDLTFMEIQIERQSTELRGGFG